MSFRMNDGIIEVYDMNLDSIRTEFDYSAKFCNLTRRLRKNKAVSYFYYQFAEDLEFDDLPSIVEDSDYFNKSLWGRKKEDLLKRAERVSSCCNVWIGDYYPLQGVKDLKTTNLCGDRFCDNCQNAFAVQRSEKYEPILLKLSEEYDIFHVILTVPNVYLDKLSYTLDKMFKCYKYLCRYLDGRATVSEVNYKEIGCYGSIRALEITKNKEKNTYHPHFHCLWICKKGSKVLNVRREVNVYSFKDRNSHIPKNYHKDEPRMFSEFEVLIQKTWRLLYDGVEVNRFNLDNLKLGYSCQMVNARGNYKEVFKYATKGLLSSEPNKSPVDSAADFDLLFVTLYRRRLIQGYGCLYRLKFEDDLSFSPDDVYLEIVKKLHEFENPMMFWETLEVLDGNMKKNTNIKYISRKSVKALVVDDEAE